MLLHGCPKHQYLDIVQCLAGGFDHKGDRQLSNANAKLEGVGLKGWVMEIVELFLALLAGYFDWNEIIFLRSAYVFYNLIIIYFNPFLSPLSMGLLVLGRHRMITNIDSFIRQLLRTTTPLTNQSTNHSLQSFHISLLKCHTLMYPPAGPTLQHQVR
jgi:hypothetical protein